MRIHISELDQPKTIDVAGDEDWLKPLYEAFPLGAAAQSRLVGRLKLTLEEEAGSVLVRGSLTYAPVLNCGRCEKGIPFPLDLEVDVRYMPEPTANEVEKDISLTEADLDTYFLENDAVDALGLIIDTVHLEIPSRLVLTKDDDSCAICGIDLSEDRLYGTPADRAESSPFAVLKDLKLP